MPSGLVEPGPYFKDEIVIQHRPRTGTVRSHELKPVTTVAQTCVHRGSAVSYVLPETINAIQLIAIANAQGISEMATCVMNPKGAHVGMESAVLPYGSVI